MIRTLRRRRGRTPAFAPDPPVILLPPLARARPSLPSWAILLACAALVGCDAPDAKASRGSPVAPAAAAGTLVELGEVRVGTMQRIWSAVGSLRADESVIVRPEITGRIVELGFEEGQRVARGDLLFALDASVFDAELAQAKANLALATRNASRAEELFGRELIPSAERDATTAALNVAKAAVALAEAQAAKAVIRAPFDGRMGLRSAAVGDYVTPGQDLVSIENLDRMKLEFRLPELALSDVAEGQPLEVTLDAYPGQTFSGAVYAIDSRVADDTRSIAARARLDNADGRLRPGLFARINLVVETRNDALLVPEQAIIMRGERAFVFAVQDGKAMEREVMLGQRRKGEAEVMSGLEAGQEIVVSGIQQVSNGSSVRTAAPADRNGQPAANDKLS